MPAPVHAFTLRRVLCALALLGGALASGGCGSSLAGAATPQAAPDRIILFIADGAGVAHWTMSAYEDPDSPLYRMEAVGLVDTRGSDHEVSGSAPTATAYAIGERSFMGAIGMNGDTVPGESVTDVAQARGWATGVMTTTSIVDATPAAFSAHAVNRYQSAEIARQMVRTGHTVVMGGGGRAFGPEVQEDDGALLSEIRDGYRFVTSMDELRSLNPERVDRLFALVAEGEMGPIAERGEDTFQEMVATALAVLDRDPEGFFLMVENEESDSRSHANDSREIVQGELRDFLESVSLALEYQADHPGTLVVVTSDHETGGVTLPYRDRGRDMVMEYATGGHTGVMVPIFARGPGAERFIGILPNDRVGAILKELAGGR